MWTDDALIRCDNFQVLGAIAQNKGNRLTVSINVELNHLKKEHTQLILINTERNFTCKALTTLFVHAKYFTVNSIE